MNAKSAAGFDATNASAKLTSEIPKGSIDAFVMSPALLLLRVKVRFKDLMIPPVSSIETG